MVCSALITTFLHAGAGDTQLYSNKVMCGENNRVPIDFSNIDLNIFFGVFWVKSNT